MSWFKRKPKKDLRSKPNDYYRETQTSIADWGYQQFGPAGSSLKIGARANEEMSELMTALARAHSNQKVAEEMADVVIVLSQLAAHIGVDLRKEVDKKMEINRNRTWTKTENGYYHEKGPAVLASSGTGTANCYVTGAETSNTIAHFAFKK